MSAASSTGISANFGAVVQHCGGRCGLEGLVEASGLAPFFPFPSSVSEPCVRAESSARRHLHRQARVPREAPMMLRPRKPGPRGCRVRTRELRLGLFSRQPMNIGCGGQVSGSGEPGWELELALGAVGSRLSPSQALARLWWFLPEPFLSFG
jgi:hypothetical protein